MAAAAGAPDVIIVGAGHSGLAVSACLSLHGVPSLVLERDDCVGSLWRKRAYDRLTLHLPKSVSALPRAPHPANAPAYLPRDAFARYLDAYAARFRVRARLRREVRAARFDPGRRRWVVECHNLNTRDAEVYEARFLVVATGSCDEMFVPELPGLETFPGKVMHAGEYKSPDGLEGKAVLVVGCGNSGMEIALDVAEAGVLTSIVVRGEVHILTKEILNLGIKLFMYLPTWMLDKLVLFLCYLVFGNTSKHGLRRPAMGPFARQLKSSVPPVVDVGTYKKIESGEIQILPAIRSVHGSNVEFADGRRYPFDAIVFATGYRSAMKRWLQVDDAWLTGDDKGILQKRCPKAENGLYYAGFSGRGIQGSGTSAEFIAQDISKPLHRPEGQARPVAATRGCGD